MAEIVASIEISRRPEDVFPYVADPSHHPEWIESVVSVRREDDAPLAVGSRVLATRRVGPWKLRYSEEMVEPHPPRSWANRGVGGIPVIAIANGTVEPLDDGKRSRVRARREITRPGRGPLTSVWWRSNDQVIGRRALTIACEFQGHGIGRLLVPLLVRRLAKQLPRDEQKLKELLERGAYAQT